MMDGSTDHTSGPISWVLAVVLCLAPFLFLPVFADPYTAPKWIFFLLLGTMSIGSVLVTAIVQKKILLSSSTYSVIFFPIVGALLYNLLFVSKNRIEALIDPFGLPTWIACIAVIICIPPILSRHARMTIRWFLAIVSGLLGLLAIYQALGIPSMFASQFPMLGEPLFTPFGSPIAAIVCSFLLLPNFVKLIQDARASKNDTLVVLMSISLILSVVGTISLMVRSVDLFQTSVLPLSYAWSVTLDSWKQVMHALTGVGSERYLPTYLLYRPQELNITNFWNAGFSYGPTTMLHIALTQGVLGITSVIAMCFMLVRAMNHGKSHHHSVYLPIILGIWVISLFCMPPVPVALILLSVLMVTYDETDHQSIGVRPLGFVVLTTFIVPLIVGGAFLAVQATRAEYGLSMVSQYASSGNTAGAYNEMTHVVAAMSMVANHHVTMSQLTIRALQALLSSSSTDTAGQLSKEDADIASTLANQAVNEAKRATTLSPDNALMWANVARVYQSLVGNAQNADQYAIASYRQSIALDPVNPTLHMDLGVLFAGLKQYDAAVNELLTALVLKPDYANAVYNLANIYRIKGDYDNANRTIEQLKKMTANDLKSQNQIKELEDQIQKEKEKPLESPTPLPTPTP